MQTTAIRTVAYSLPENEAILLTLLISNRYILFAELANIFLSPYFFVGRRPNLCYRYLFLCLEQAVVSTNSVRSVWQLRKHSFQESVY